MSIWILIFDVLTNKKARSQLRFLARGGPSFLRGGHKKFAPGGGTPLWPPPVPTYERQAKKAWQIGWPSVYLSARHLWFHQTLIMANNSSILSNCSPWSNQLSNNPMEVIIITVTRNFSSWKTIESSTWSRLIMIGAVPLWHWPKRMTAQIFHMTEKTKNMILVITNAN